jgi:hypothetical protein
MRTRDVDRLLGRVARATRPSDKPRGLAAITAVVVALGLLAALAGPTGASTAAGTTGASTPTGTTGASTPNCFGAASRDPLHQCSNPQLNLMVQPTPAAALLVPDAPCNPVQANIPVCTFGVPESQATRTIALVGDSHAHQWLATLEVVAQALDWSGFLVSRSSCPFSLATLIHGYPLGAQCEAWNRGVEQWFAGQPEISVVFTSAHVTGAPVIPKPGQNEMQAWVAGITSAWAGLPASVKHIVVIRDDPTIETSTLPCVTHAIAKHENAGLTCAFPRRLITDPDVVAADALNSSRVQVADLTRFFCGSTLCYPVVGGVLVYKDDFDHLTRLYATTLAPYLQRAIHGLIASSP